MIKVILEAFPHLGWITKKFDKRTELTAALVGAILVIPQGVSFAYLTGVPPEHGIYCAIIVTFFAALFGNSIMMTGPNTATSILIGLAILPFAGRGSPLFIDYVMILSLMIGVIQLTAWLLRASNIFYLITPAAISGITTGIGFMIMVWSLDGILGIANINANFFYEPLYILALKGYELVNGYALVVGSATVVTGFIAQRFFHRYWIFIPIFVGTIIGLTIDSIWPQHITELEFLGSLNIANFQLYVPKLHSDYLLVAIQLIPAAFLIAFISLTHSLVIARDLKLRKDPSINLNKEVFALGFANVLAPFFFSFAGAGSFNRTQVNEDMQVKTPLAALLTGLFVVAIIISIGSLFFFVPTAVIAGLLFLVGFSMIKWHRFLNVRENVPAAFSFYAITLTVIFLGLMPAVLLAIGTSIYTVVMGHIYEQHHYPEENQPSSATNGRLDTSDLIYRHDNLAGAKAYKISDQGNGKSEQFELRSRDGKVNFPL